MSFSKAPYIKKIDISVSKDAWITPRELLYSLWSKGIFVNVESYVKKVLWRFFFRVIFWNVLQKSISVFMSMPQKINFSNQRHLRKIHTMMLKNFLGKYWKPQLKTSFNHFCHEKSHQLPQLLLESVFQDEYFIFLFAELKVYLNSDLSC